MKQWYALYVLLCSLIDFIFGMHIHCGMQDLGHIRKPTSQLIKYAHMDSITDFCILVIPEAIFQS